MTTQTVPSLDDLLQASAATSEFKDAVRRFAQSAEPGGLIEFNRTAPAVKVLRVVMQLLDREPGLAIEKAEVIGHAGCSDFVGDLTAHVGGEQVSFSFNWDCKWRADQEGWRDLMGFSDQGRAARAFGYQCFKDWRRVG